MEILINLLPWREQQREESKKQFFMMGGAVAAVMVLLFTVIYLVYMLAISDQKSLNNRLKNEIALLDVEIEKIKILEDEKNRLVARMLIIQELQARRPQTVKLFDALVRLMPSGIYLKEMNRTTDRVTLLGVADSNAEVSNLMRSLEKSGWLINPLLTQIKTLVNKEGQRFLEFEMSFDIMMDLPGSTMLMKIKEKTKKSKDKDTKKPNKNSKAQKD